MKVKFIYKTQRTDIKNILLAGIFSIGTYVIYEYLILPIYYMLFYGHLGAAGQRIGKAIHDIFYGILSITNIFIAKSFLTLILGVGIFILYYCLLSRKRAKHLEEIMISSKEMASKGVYTKLDENIKGDVGQLSRNINYIVESLQGSLEEQKILEKTKTDLITNVSHDLRTPLTSIIGYLSIVDDDKYKDEVELRYYVNIAYEKAKGLNILIDDLFELTRMRSSSITINKREIDICELVGQVAADFYPQLNENNMEIKLNLPNDKIILEADPSKIVRVVENLISNAIRYGKEGKYINVSLNLINAKKEYVKIDIENIGEIAQVDIPFVFDRFYRVDKSRTAENRGSGLGLAITKSIVELHKGDINVYSDNGITRFEVKIPRL